MIATRYEIVAVAASAGGLKALTTLLAALPADFAAPLLIVQHLEPRRPSLLARLLGRATTLSVREGAAGENILPGTVYVAPPDRHLIVDRARRLDLTRSAAVCYVRPSADRLFESIAATYGERAIALVLSGTGRDGAHGVKAVKQAGGTVIVQDPASAEFRGMPDAAMQAASADFVLPLGAIAPALVTLVDARRAA